MAEAELGKVGLVIGGKALVATEPQPVRRDRDQPSFDLVRAFQVADVRPCDRCGIATAGKAFDLDHPHLLITLQGGQARSDEADAAAHSKRGELGWSGDLVETDKRDLLDATLADEAGSLERGSDVWPVLRDSVDERSGQGTIGIATRRAPRVEDRHARTDQRVDRVRD